LCSLFLFFSFFFFNDTATTEIYTLSLHDALPISGGGGLRSCESGQERVPLPDEPRAPDPAQRDSRIRPAPGARSRTAGGSRERRDRKSTRLNSSHSQISYAVFCLKKKNNTHHTTD